MQRITKRGDKQYFASNALVFDAVHLCRAIEGTFSEILLPFDHIRRLWPHFTGGENQTVIYTTLVFSDVRGKGSDMT